MITSEQTRLELSRSLKPSRFQRRIKHVKSESSESDPTTVSQKPEPFPSRKRNVRAASGTGKTRARPAQPLRRECILRGEEPVRCAQSQYGFHRMVGSLAARN